MSEIIPEPGDFTCASLQQIKARVTQIFAPDGGANIKSEYIADVEAAKAILETQTARFEVLKNPEKDREVKVWWVDDCDQEEPVDCTDQCVVEGEEIHANCKDYALTECFEKPMSITEEQFRTSELDWEEVVATQLAKKLLLMDQHWATKSVAFLDANAGVNSYTDQYTVDGNSTFVPAPAWNPDLFGYFDLVQWMNKLSVSNLLSGTLLKQYVWKLQLERNNPNGPAELAKMLSMGLPRFDRRLDDLLGAKGLLMWDPGATALVTKARYTNDAARGGRELIADGGKQIRTTIMSPNLKDVVYDLTYQQKCVGDDVKHSWKIVSRGGLFLNPLGCNKTRTGILKFVCGEAPEVEVGD